MNDRGRTAGGLGSGPTAYSTFMCQNDGPAPEIAGQPSCPEGTILNPETGECFDPQDPDNCTYGCMDESATNYDPNATCWGDPTGSTVDPGQMGDSDGYEGITYGPFVCTYNYSCDDLEAWALKLMELANINMEWYEVPFPDIDPLSLTSVTNAEEMIDHLCNPEYGIC